MFQLRREECFVASDTENMNFGVLNSPDESESNTGGIIAHRSEILMWRLVFKG